MNKDANISVSSKNSVTQDALEKNLISALSRLQYTAFEKAFLGGGVPLAENAKPESFFGFSVGSYHFMVAASCFCEVLVDAAIASIPNAPSCLVGLSNVRGVLIPIYQLHSTLSLELPKKVNIFLVGKGDSAVGVLIDGLPISLLISASQRHAVTQQESAVLQPLIAFQYFSGQQHWLGLNGLELGPQLLALASQPNKSNTYFSSGREFSYS